MRKSVLTLALLTASFTTANAATIFATGIFGSDVPTTSYTVPNVNWAFIFNASDVPIVTASTSTGFTIAIDTLDYIVSGKSVVTPGFTATFNTAASGGGFEISSADSSFQAYLYGPQLFYGTTDFPVFAQADYSPTSGYFSVDGTVFGSGDGSNAGDVVNAEAHVLAGVTQTPEPAAFALFGLGFAGIAFRRKATAHA